MVAASPELAIHELAKRPQSRFRSDRKSQPLRQAISLRTIDAPRHRRGPGLFSIGGETEAARVARRRATLGVAL